MDLVSGGELFRAEMAGVKGERIVFSGVGKTPGEIASALQYDGGKGIFSFNVESVPELEMINAVALELGFQARIALRFNPDVDAKTHPYISTGLKRNKFGLNRSEILSVVTDIAENPEHYGGILFRGVGIHIGSQLLSLAPLADSFTRMRALIDEIERRLPGSLEFADLVEGSVLLPERKSPEIDRYCALIQRHFARTKLKILIEPGRITLATRASSSLKSSTARPGARRISSSSTRR